MIVSVRLQQRDSVGSTACDSVGSTAGKGIVLGLQLAKGQCRVYSWQRDSVGSTAGKGIVSGLQQRDSLGCTAERCTHNKVDSKGTV